jgi:signal transduction histidine kinase
VSAMAEQRGVARAFTKLLSAAAEYDARIAWLIRLRWLAVVGVICVLEVGRRVLHLQLALQHLYLTIAALAIYNLILTLICGRLRRGPPGTAVRPEGFLARLLPEPVQSSEAPVQVFGAAPFASVQIAIDLLFLALLLHFSGGIENPFVFFFIFHVIVASILLSRPATFFHATLGLALFSAVALGELFGVLPHYPLHEALQPGAYRDPRVVAVGLLALGATLYLSAYMGTAIAGHLRTRVRESVTLSRKLAEKARLLEAAYQRASESERTKSQYMRKVAHELRGPIGTIQTALKVVLQGLVGEVPENLRELVARAERRAGDVAQVTVDLLTLSRAREAPLEVEMVTIEPADLVSEVVAEYSEAAARAGVTLHSCVPAKLGPVRVDPEGLRQLVGNLLENGIRYTPSGGRVELRMGRGERGLRLEVEDTGIGIAPEDLPRVFDEFYRAPNAREHSSDGTGLGLAIVKAVAEQHGGCVTIDSVPGRGTLVIVDLSVEPPGRGGKGLAEGDTVPGAHRASRLSP